MCVYYPQEHKIRSLRFELYQHLKYECIFDLADLHLSSETKMLDYFLASQEVLYLPLQSPDYDRYRIKKHLLL